MAVKSLIPGVHSCCQLQCELRNSASAPAWVAKVSEKENLWKRGIPRQSDLLLTHSMSWGRTPQTFLVIIWILKLDFRSCFPSWTSFPPLVLSTWESSKSDLLAPSHVLFHCLLSQSQKQEQMLVEHSWVSFWGVQPDICQAGLISWGLQGRFCWIIPICDSESLLQNLPQASKEDSLLWICAQGYFLLVFFKKSSFFVVFPCWHCYEDGERQALE